MINIESESENSTDNESDENEMIKPSPANLSVGTYYVHVQIMSGKRKCTNYVYAALIQEKLSFEEYGVVGLKSLYASYKHFKLIETDVFTVPLGDILAILPNQLIEKVRNVSKRIFSCRIDVREQ